MTKSKLMKLLSANHISTETWGTGKAKTVDHLLQELRSGEARIEAKGKRLVRTAYGAVLQVYYHNGSAIKKLVEQKQVFRDGRVKTRSLEASIGEKMKPDENPVEAAYRALREELKISRRLHLQKLDPIIKGPVPSESFPGLMTLYHMHVFEVWIPDDLYQRRYVERQADKTNYYVWKLNPG